MANTLQHVSIEELKVRITWYFVGEEKSLDNSKISETVDIKKTAVDVLNYLIRENVIGYLNYQLLKEFQEASGNKELEKKINNYEECYKKFLKLTNLRTLAKVFKDNPEIAPASFIGLPKFTVDLDTEWEGKRAYQWIELLNKQFDWPSYIHIASITRKCIIIEYSVLPFFAPAVVRDLKDPEILSMLEGQGVMVELSYQLKQMSLEEETKGSLTITEV